MSDTAGRGWVLFELPTVTEISRIVWSRDRTGKLTDRLPTAYRLEIGTDLNNNADCCGRSTRATSRQIAGSLPIDLLQFGPSAFALQFWPPTAWNRASMS